MHSKSHLEKPKCLSVWNRGTKSLIATITTKTRNQHRNAFLDVLEPVCFIKIKRKSNHYNNKGTKAPSSLCHTKTMTSRKRRQQLTNRNSKHNDVEVH
jgi:hypothetical protein